MASYKNIRIKKKGGGSRSQRVQVLASGKYKFVKNNPKSKSRSTKTKTKTSRRKSNPMARNKRKRSRSVLNVSTIEKYIGYGTLLYPGATRAMDIVKAEGQQSLGRAVAEGIGRYGGLYDGGFHANVLFDSWMPYIAFNLVSKGVHKLNAIIRRL